MNFRLLGCLGELGGDCGGGGGSTEGVSVDHVCSWLVPNFQLDVVDRGKPPEFPEGTSDDRVCSSSGVYGCDCGPVVAEDEDCGTGQSGQPNPGGHQEIPTF